MNSNNEVILWDGQNTDLVMNVQSVVGFAKQSFNFHTDANGVQHIGLGWFAVLGYLIFRVWLNSKKTKKGRRR